MTKKYFFLMAIIALSSCGNSSALFPHRYIGKYHGIQPAYQVQMNGAPIKVPSENYTLVLDYGKIYLTTDEKTTVAHYSIKAETKMYYSFTVELKNGTIEEWKLWKKGKRLIRQPIIPQPKTIFSKK